MRRILRHELILLNLNVGFSGSYILLVKEVDAKTSGDLAAVEHSISEADTEMKMEYVSN